MQPRILSWAHDAFNEGEFDEADLEVIRDVVARLGLADMAAFGLTPLPRPLRCNGHLLESMATESLLDLYVPPLIDSTSKEVMIAMAKSLAKLSGQPQMSSKLHRHLKKAGHSDVTLKDIQESLSGIGVSLSKRVIEERNKR